MALQLTGLEQVKVCAIQIHVPWIHDSVWESTWLAWQLGIVFSSKDAYVKLEAFIREISYKHFDISLDVMLFWAHWGYKPIFQSISILHEPR